MNYNQLTTSDFVRKGNIIHNNKYDYSNVYYINSRMKVCIICPKHGEFWQIPANHLCGKGCKECQRETLIVKNLSNTDDFIKKSKIIHDGRYEYSKVDYVNAHKKICIVCFEHGEFWQTPNSHLNGRGCPYCAKVSKGENKIDKFLVSSKIKFVRENRFDGCKGARQPLPFDFYLPDSNTCIEYDGKQHFDKKSKYYSDELIINDKIKDKYCLSNDIRLVRISYKEYKNIDKILKSIIEEEING